MRIRPSFEKILFWSLTVAVLLLMAVVSVSMFPHLDDVWSGNQLWFTGMAAAVLLFLVLNTVIAVLVHKDASHRGMNAWLWMTAVIYIPNFIGLLLYFLVRKQQKMQIGNELVAAETKEYCPHCGKLIHS